MRSATIAIFDASSDTVEMLTCLFSAAGMRAVTGPPNDVSAGRFDFVAYMAVHKPEAVIWDIPPPYDVNWGFFKLLRRIGPLQDRAIVLTTTNKPQVDALVSRDSARVEVLGKPYDPQDVLDAVKRAIEMQERAGSGAATCTTPPPL